MEELDRNRRDDGGDKEEEGDDVQDGKEQKRMRGRQNAEASFVGSLQLKRCVSSNTVIEPSFFGSNEAFVEVVQPIAKCGKECLRKEESNDK